MTDENVTLDDVVRDSKTLLDPALVGVNIDWERSEVALLARVEAEARFERARLGGRRRLWAGAALALAAAAAIPLFLARGGDRAVSLEHAAVDAVGQRSAGALVRKEGRGEVRIGAPAAMTIATAGSALERGDAAEAHDAKGFFQRDNQVTWALEDGARVAVRGTHGALVLALERGAVEAQVTPVPAGEAFAVDVEGTRVAVHGTHLRVARDGTRVMVDLTEGVVSIGAPPRTGSTYGQLVNAPAHIEFDANDPKGTMKVTHDPARVRAALALRAPAENVVAVSPRMTIPPAAAAAPPAPYAAAPAQAAAVGPVAGPGPSARSPSARGLVLPSAGAAGAAATSAPLADPEKAIAGAVLACARSQAGDSERPEDVTITVSSKLVLRIGDDGAVMSARFEPPLAPEVQTCASGVIYGARFPAAGTRTIPLDFQR
jgi:ferric-dicitrate binding protein FerR (iron transport regulator)